MTERRAPVNGAPHGTISWTEHVAAWETYARVHSGQDAETIAKRGGFGLEELVSQLGHMPRTWEPNAHTIWITRFRGNTRPRGAGEAEVQYGVRIEAEAEPLPHSAFAAAMSWQLVRDFDDAALFRRTVTYGPWQPITEPDLRAAVEAEETATVSG